MTRREGGEKGGVWKKWKEEDDDEEGNIGGR